MNDYVISNIRTFVPILVGAIVAWLATKNIPLDPKSVDGLIALGTSGFTLLYYLIIHALEQKWPKFGWLLGYAKTPQYDGKAVETK